MGILYRFCRVQDDYGNSNGMCVIKMLKPVKKKKGRQRCLRAILHLPSSWKMMSTLTTPLSPVGEACLRTDLTAIHEIVEKLGYKDDEGAARELSFQMWTNQMQDSLNFKKKSDVAFRHKDFANAVECYS